jgi:hypothetical protein
MAKHQPRAPVRSSPRDARASNGLPLIALSVVIVAAVGLLLAVVVGGPVADARHAVATRRRDQHRPHLADKEISALLATDRVIPMVHGVTFEELRDVSPLLAARWGWARSSRRWKT